MTRLEEFEAEGLASIDAERAVLGSMLLSARAARQCAGMLKPEHFLRPAHRIVFAAMSSLLEEDSPVDGISLEERLKDRGQVQDIGGADYIIELVEFVSSPANSGYYAGLVLEKASKRSDLEAAQKLQRLIIENASLEEIRAFKHSLSRESVSRREVPVRPLHQFDPVRDSSGRPTGFSRLDALSWRGGFAKGQVTVVQAGTGRGKSTWMMSSAFRLVQEGFRVMYATFADLDGDEIYYRAVRSLVGFGRPKTLEEQQRWDEARAYIEKSWDFEVYDACAVENGDTEIESFAAWFENAHAEKPYHYAFLDYAQEIQSSSPKANNEFAEQHIVGRFCRVLAARSGIPFVIGSQVTEVAGGQTKTRNSRVWENVAGWILEVREDGMFVKKNRFGARDTTAPHAFDPSRAVFIDA